MSDQTNGRHIISVCHCVIDEISLRNIPFNYVPDDLLYDDYHNARENCGCKSGEDHYQFSYI